MLPLTRCFELIITIHVLLGCHTTESTDVAAGIITIHGGERGHTIKDRRILRNHLEAPLEAMVDGDTRWLLSRSPS